MSRRLLIAAAMLIACVTSGRSAESAPTAAATSAPAPDFGLLRDTPVFLQEWHIWWGFPWPDLNRPMGHLNSSLTANLEPWRLNWDRPGYPYPGIYDSRNPEIIRWQIRCIKACGFESVAVMIHPEMNKGVTFIQEENGATDSIITRILNIAAEEKYPVFFMDEVAFRHGSCARDPEVMRARIIHFIQKFGAHPGFYKRAGMPVYYYQTFGYDVGIEKTNRMMEQVEKQTGPVWWMIFGGVDYAGKMPLVKAIISAANIHRQNGETRTWDFNIQNPAYVVKQAEKYGKPAGDIHYPKFDGTSQPWRQTGVALYGKAGETLALTVRESLKAKPQVLMLSSWNDWEEGANLEPGWDFDGFTGDPFTYCRVIARLKGRDFVPPPPPAKEAVHPTIREKLGYGDGAGPIIERLRRPHDKGGSIEIVARDSQNPVTALEVVWNGDLYWKAPQQEGAPAEGNIVCAQLEKAEALPVRNVLEFQVGRAVEVGSEPLVFRPNAVPDGFPAQPAVGVIYAFDRVSPFKGPAVEFPRQTPVVLSEPAGLVRNTVGVRFHEAFRSDQANPWLWDGWQSGVAFAPSPLDLPKLVADGARLSGTGEKLAMLSLLGAPQEARCLKTPPAIREAGGLRATYYTLLPDAVLDTPGLHAVWVRAKDAAGNWGSPVLLPVPNFEPYKRAAQRERDVIDAPQGALLWDDLRDLRKWKAGKNTGQRIVRKEEFVVGEHLGIGNAIYGRAFPAQDTAKAALQVSVKMLLQKYQTAAGLWLTDESGQNGYGLCWDAGKEDQNGGNGSITLRRLQIKEPVEYEDHGEILTRASSGHRAVGPEYAQIELRIAAGELILSVDGKERARTKAAEFTAFSRLYLYGAHAPALFDEVTVTGAEN